MFDSKLFLATAPKSPGVYLMQDKHKAIVYVGKAKNLKKRLASYFQKKHSDSKTAKLVSQIVFIQTIITNSENEALLLENNLIKQHSPKYNIIFRDDKSYPYIFLSDDKCPRLIYLRGKKKLRGEYFGPYPNTASVKKTIDILQKIFHLRSCKNSFFSGRARPCLQFQIKRCSAPCVKKISQTEYNDDVKMVRKFLQGKHEEVAKHLIAIMNKAAEKKEYELAAKYRNQIQAIREIGQQQIVYKNTGDLDIIAIYLDGGCAAINLLMVRGGQILGNKTFTSKIEQFDNAAEILESFLSQYYFNYCESFPKEIVVSQPIVNVKIIAVELTKKIHRKISIKSNVRGDKAALIEMSEKNGIDFLKRQLSSRSSFKEQFIALNKVLNLPSTVFRIECFDVSHLCGNETVASCVVFSNDGPAKNDYRRFNISGITAGDDFAALKQAISRRYSKLKIADAKLPDLVIIDGGKGQLKQAENVFEELQIQNVILMAIAKGKERKAGKEIIFLSGKTSPLEIENTSIAFHLLQFVRDEAHRFAIQGHRARRIKKQKESLLQSIEGIGQKKRQELLKHFGGIQGIKKASQNDLQKVKGINVELAKKIFVFFRA